MKDSWAKVAPFAGAAAAIFFDRLVEQDPVFGRAFPASRRGRDIEAFTRLVTQGVRSLGELEELVPAAAELGRRAAELGFRDAHYRAMAEALIGSLERVLGSDLSPAVRRAWGEAILTVAAAARRGRGASRPPVLVAAPLGPPPGVAICPAA